MLGKIVGCLEKLCSGLSWREPWLALAWVKIGDESVLVELEVVKCRLIGGASVDMTLVHRSAARQKTEMEGQRTLLRAADQRQPLKTTEPG